MHQARENYLATEVLTAAPQKLQLMLIEGALRFGEQARAFWRAGRNEEAGEAIIRCQQIMAQLLGGIHPERDPALARQVAGLYAFVFNALIAAHVDQDEAKLEEALAVLAEEQITWRAVCDQLGTQRRESEETERLQFNA